MSSNPDREKRRSRLESFLSAAERSDPVMFNMTMILLIVVVSGVLSVALWSLAVTWLGRDPAQNWRALSFLSAVTVATIVATPAVWFGYFLLRRIQSIRDDLRVALQATDVANRAKTEFLANMSHEIRTPLNGVLGMAQVLEHSDMTEDQRESLRMIGESGDLLMAIIADVLDLSKIESGHISLEPVPGELADVLAGTVELFRARADEQGTTLVYMVDSDVPEAVIYDSVRVRQCLANLVSNAIKFTRNGQVSVRLSVQPQDDGWLVILTVTDTGIGIDAATLPRLFQPFEQADASTSRTYGGTGLGLALSRRFARLMGGEIIVRSEPGTGSCFEMTFYAGRIEDADMKPERTGRDIATPRDFLHGYTVLVVDDSRINRRVVQGLLKPFGPVCLEAEDGVHALEVLDRERVDIVFMDMHMPKMDGRTTLAALQKRPPPICHIPVIALTADVLQGKREDYLDLGFHGYLAKPLRRADLEAELLRIVGAEQGHVAG